MAITVNTNVPSLTAQRNLLSTQNKMGTALQRLSSGLRINSAKDDAAGLAITDRMTSQVRGLNQAVRNANDGISLAQTTEGALQETTVLLQRMRELAVQSANDTNNSSDRASLQDEINQVQSEINRIAETTQFNGKNLLDGTFGQAKFHVGAEANQIIQIGTGDARGTKLGSFQSYLTSETATFDSTDTLTDGTNTDYQAGGGLAINGPKGSAVAAIKMQGSTAKDTARQINFVTGETGVTATARTEAKLSGFLTEGSQNYKFDLSTGSGNGVAISASVIDGDLNDLVDSINDVSGSTGVVATLNDAGDEITIVDHDGDNLSIKRLDKDASTWNFESTHANVNNTGTVSGDVSGGAGSTSVQIRGAVLLESAKNFSIDDSGTVSGGGIVDITEESNDTNVSSLSSVDEIDITTQFGANSAISVVDKAISRVDQIRSNLGAIQNRFQSTISNLSNVSENISSSRSRILDADFAQETAALTKAQILSQAGLSMLSQANQLPQSALSLLQ